MTTERLKLADIRTDGGTQPRAELIDEVVSEYAEAYIRGDTLPPITVYYDGTDYWPADGYHRMAACRRHGAYIDADVRQGTQRDAILASCGANAAHGLRRSADDKRRAVARLLEDPEWQQWSDREIARVCHVGNRFVGDLRRELCPDTVGGSRKYTRAGKEHTMDTAAIGETRGGMAPVHRDQATECRLVAGLATLQKEGWLPADRASQLASMTSDRQYAVFDAAIDAGIRMGKAVDWEAIITAGETNTEGVTGPSGNTAEPNWPSYDEARSAYATDRFPKLIKTVDWRGESWVCTSVGSEASGIRYAEVYRVMPIDESGDIETLERDTLHLRLRPVDRRMFWHGMVVLLRKHECVLVGPSEEWTWEAVPELDGEALPTPKDGSRYDIFTDEEPPDEKQAEIREWHAGKKAESEERSRDTGLALLMEELRQLLEIEDATMFGRAVLGTLALIAPTIAKPASRHFAAQYPEEAPQGWGNAEKLHAAGWTPVRISADDPQIIEAYSPDGWWQLAKRSSKTATEKLYRGLTGTGTDWLPFIDAGDTRKAMRDGFVLYRDRGDSGVWRLDKDVDGWTKCTDGKSYSELLQHTHALEG